MQSRQKHLEMLVMASESEVQSGETSPSLSLSLTDLRRQNW